MKGDIYRAALVAGLISGALSGIPILSLGNCLCCLWIVGGGALATYLYQRTSSAKLNAGDGLSVGALSGFLAALVATPLDLIFFSWSRGLMMEIMKTYGMDASAFQAYWVPQKFASSFLMRIILFSLFSAIGGAIGTGIFKPKTHGNS